MRIADKNFSLIIFGASGALAKYKIFPALYQMALEGRMPASYNVIGFARTKKSHQEFREEFKESICSKNENVDMKILESVLDRVFYFTGNYDEESSYTELLKFTESVEGDTDEVVRLAYFSVPPVVFADVVEGLGATFKKSYAPIRLILEKPFGSDYAGAKELKAVLTQHFNQDEIYLLDHYLGKEGVFNLLSLRYANPIFSYLLQGKYISNVQITAFESEGLEGRAGYFDAVGTLKDMVQSHLFQILAFLTMNVPREFTTALVHKAKTQSLENIYFDEDPNNVVRAQYSNYKNESGVAVGSKTETYVAMKLGIDNPDWHGVPIYFRTGKSLAKKWTSVVIEFKPHQNQNKLHIEGVNRLVIEIQPQEKVEFYMMTKMGGEELSFVPFTTGKPIYCSGDCLLEHQRLLLDAIKGDRLLFLDFPEIYASWKQTDKVMNLFKSNLVDLVEYPCSSNGPKAADDLLARDGFSWFNG
jgi:glucose-6-phosphate 1-dehydrogenase